MCVCVLYLSWIFISVASSSRESFLASTLPSRVQRDASLAHMDTGKPAGIPSASPRAEALVPAGTGRNSSASSEAGS